MNATSHRPSGLRRHARGFSLIELGIVIAVIAVLASVVIFGRGFITAGRVSKTVEAINTIRKAGAAYAGLQGGTVAPSTGPEIANLGRRSLLPVDDRATKWTVAGSDANEFKVTNIQFGVVNRQNAVAVTLETPDAVQAEDVFNSVRIDQNYVRTNAPIGTLNCAGETKPSSNIVTVCFSL